ncbi:MAG: alpha/beta fold hydrolase [Pseudomonadota bacterium]
MINWSVRAASLAAVISTFICFNLAYATPSLKDYGSLPEVEHVALSPSGDLVAFHRVTAEYNRIVVLSLAKNKQLRVIDVTTTSPDSIRFLTENKLALVMSKTTFNPMFEDPFELSTAFLLDIEEGTIRQLLIPGDAPVYAGQTGLGRVLGVSPDGIYAYMPAFTFKEKTLSRTDDGVGVVYRSLLKVNLKEKRAPLIVSRGDRNTRDFFLDSQGNVLAEESYSEHFNLQSIRARINDDWVDIFKEKTEIQTKSFVGVTPDYKSLIMIETNPDTGRKAYYSMLLADGSVSGPIFGRDDADIETIIKTNQGVVLGVRYSGFRPSYHFFDPQLNNKIKEITATFPEQSVYLQDHSADWKKIVVYVAGPNAPSDYYLFSEGKPAQFLTSARPQIKPEDLNPIGTVTFTARDGLKIPTLLTIPKEKVANMKNLPAVILPHGGPESYDRMGFDWEAQALANNGYLVIQPQFRGSSGFGAKHTQAGYGEWGKKMQDDLSDAVAFAVKKGMIDPNRVCIVGSSYGGYAALAGGAFTPDLYKCVVSVAGIGDLKNMLNWDKGENGKYSEVLTYMKRQFTNGEADTKAMAAASPERFAENFKAPVLLIHGEADKRVPVSQSKDMNSALKRANKSVIFIELEDEDHHLSNTKTRLQTLEEIVKFVNAHIGQGNAKASAL